jgi:hypothetical protein
MGIPMNIDISPEEPVKLDDTDDQLWRFWSDKARALSAALKDKQDDTYLRGFAAGQLSLKNAGEFTVIDSPELADLRAALTEAATNIDRKADFIEKTLNDMAAMSQENYELKIALTASQAETAAAYEVAATCTEWTAWGERHNLTDASRRAIRALTPADSKAALDRMIALAAIPKGTYHE